MLSPIELRHWMHEHPELSFQEEQVTRLLLEELLGWKDLKLLRPLNTGLVAVHQPRPEEPFVLFRADMDALPMRDDANGKMKPMHSCGHDVHTAILFGLIQRCLEEQVQTNAVFVFQPAEETGGGAKHLLDSGVLEPYKIQSAYALHVSDAFPLGTIASAMPTLFSSSQELDLHWKGMQSHITQPEKGRDTWKACVALEQWKANSQDLLSEGFFLGIGQVEAGTVRNSVSDSAVMRMTARGKTTEILHKGLEKVQQAVREVELKYGVEASLTYGSYYPAVEQNQELFDRWMKDFGEQGKVENCDPVWAAEDFGFFAQQYPSWMFWLGTRLAGEPAYGLHHRKFYPPDDAINEGINVFFKLLSK